MEFVDVSSDWIAAVKLRLMVVAVLGADFVLGEDCLRELVGVFEGEITVPSSEGFNALTIISSVPLSLQEMLLRRRDVLL